MMSSTGWCDVWSKSKGLWGGNSSLCFHQPEVSSVFFFFFLTSKKNALEGATGGQSYCAYDRRQAPDGCDINWGVLTVVVLCVCARLCLCVCSCVFNLFLFLCPWYNASVLLLAALSQNLIRSLMAIARTPRLRYGASSFSSHWVIYRVGKPPDILYAQLSVSNVSAPTKRIISVRKLMLQKIRKIAQQIVNYDNR